MKKNTFRESILNQEKTLNESVTNALKDIGLIADSEGLDDDEVLLLINNYVMNLYFKAFGALEASKDSGLLLLNEHYEAIRDMWKINYHKFQS